MLVVVAIADLTDIYIYILYLIYYIYTFTHMYGWILYLEQIIIDVMLKYRMKFFGGD